MKGLLYKDILSFKLSAKSLLYVLVMALLFAIIFRDGGHFFNVMLGMSVMLLAYSTFSLDDKQKWGRYAATLPLAPYQLVGSKYLLILLTLVACACLGGATSVISRLTLGRAAALQNLLSSGWVIATYFACLAILLPLIYKLGVERTRYVSSLVFALPYLVLVLLFALGDRLPFTIEGSWFWLAIAGAVSMVLFFVSFLVSVRILKTLEY